MGVYVTRTLKSNYHVQTYINDNMDNKINFMSRILAGHGNPNRVEFGDALWNSVLRPSISHCCGAWLTYTPRYLYSFVTDRTKTIKFDIRIRHESGKMLGKRSHFPRF